MTTLTGTALDNARQVIRDGHVCGFQDGELLHLYWTPTGTELGDGIAEGVIQLVTDEEAYVTDVEVFGGLCELALAEDALSDCD